MGFPFTPAGIIEMSLGKVLRDSNVAEEGRRLGGMVRYLTWRMDGIGSKELEEQ